jgi:hypothetical protein
MINRFGIAAKLKHILLNPYNYFPLFFTYFLLRIKALIIGFDEHRKKNNGSDFVPVPPPLLRLRVHGSLNLESYLQVGKTCAQNIRDLLALIDRDLYSFNPILDFGCDNGRVMRYFSDHPASCHLYGTDIRRSQYYGVRHI